MSRRTAIGRNVLLGEVVESRSPPGLTFFVVDDGQVGGRLRGLRRLVRVVRLLSLRAAHLFFRPLLLSRPLFQALVECSARCRHKYLSFNDIDSVCEQKIQVRAESPYLQELATHPRNRESFDSSLQVCSCYDRVHHEPDLSPENREMSGLLVNLKKRRARRRALLSTNRMSKTCSTDIDCKRRGGIAPRMVSQKSPAAEGNDPRRPASGRRSGP